MAWILLLLAALFEVAWAVALPYTDGFRKPKPTLLAVVAMVLSVGFLAQAVKQIPLGTAYAVWTGIGTVGTVLFGILVLGESKEVVRLVCIGLIVAGIVGLKMTDHG